MTFKTHKHGRSDTIIIDDPYKSGEGPSQNRREKLFERMKYRIQDDVDAIFMSSCPWDDRVSSHAWTGANGTEWNLPPLWEIYIIGFMGGFMGMGLSFLIMG